MPTKLENECVMLREAELGGIGSRIGAYVKLSGPGWLQSAITLGGGSLASSLFLGVLAGYSLLWLQPVAIVLRRHHVVRHIPCHLIHGTKPVQGNQRGHKPRARLGMGNSHHPGQRGLVSSSIFSWYGCRHSKPVSCTEQHLGLRFLSALFF